MTLIAELKTSASVPGWSSSALVSSCSHQPFEQLKAQIHDFLSANNLFAMAIFKTIPTSRPSPYHRCTCNMQAHPSKNPGAGHFPLCLVITRPLKPETPYTCVPKLVSIHLIPSLSPVLIRLVELFVRYIRLPDRPNAK